MPITYEQIKKYADAGLCIAPTHFGEKRPALITWTKYQSVRPTADELKEWFAPEKNRDGMGIICGQISGGLEVIDFDKQGQEFPFWAESVKKRLPDLYPKLVIERSYSGGKHVYYKCEYISGAMNLALEAKNKKLIETRGEGGFIKCAPSEGYELEQGDFDSIPVITIDEREILIAAARCRNQYVEEDKTEYMQNIPVTGEKTTAAEDGTLRPGDDFNVRGDFRGLLESLGWKPERGIRSDGNQHWTRPGKPKGTSATLKNFGGVELFYIFTSSTDLENYKAYTPFQFLTLEKFGGNFREAAKWLGGQGFGKKKYSDRTLNTKTIQVGKEKIDLDITDNPNVRDISNFNEFPLDKLPSVCQRYILDKARAQKRNPAGIASFLLAQCGSLIGASVKLKLDGDDWRVAPILWVCLIGVSGQGKSPQLDAVKKLITPKLKEYDNLYREQAKRYNSDFAQWCKDRKKGIAGAEPIPPKKRKIFLTNATFEGLAKDIQVSGSRTPMILDEFVDFFTMINRNRTPGESGKWLSLYNGGSIVTSRVQAQETTLDEGWLSMYGGATPEKFRKFVTDEGGDKDGTLSRMCIVWLPMLTEYPEQATEDEYPTIEKHRRDMQDVCETLIEFQPGEDETQEPNENGDLPLKQFEELKLCPEARENWSRLQEENFEIVNKPENATDALAGYLAKSLELTPRIAIILHCIEAAWKYNTGDVVPTTERSATGLSVTNYCDDGFVLPTEISYQTWINARYIAEWFTTETLICYELLRFIEPKTDDVKMGEILKAITDSDEGLTARDLYRMNRKYRTKAGKEELKNLLNGLLEKGYIQMEERKSDRGGRSMIVFKAKE